MKRIQESELILNPDGSVYHLHLLPEQVAKTIITVGDQNRVAEVSKHFDELEHQVEKREFVTHTGRIGSRRLTVISTGIGTDNIDIVFTELDALFNIDLRARVVKSEHTPLDFIRIGTSGCLQGDIPLDSFLASHFAIGLDNLLHFYAHQLSDKTKQLATAFDQYNQAHQLLPVKPYISQGGKGLLQYIGRDFYKGITMTAPGFYAPQNREIRLKSKISQESLDKIAEFQWDGLNVSNFEMETAGIYGMANLLGHQAISCNALIANRSQKKFSSNPKQTVEKLIKTVLEKICDS